MPAIWNSITKKGYGSSDNPKESGDELYEAATGATKTTSKTVESNKQEVTPTKKTLRQRLIDNAPAFKRGVDSIITGMVNNQRATPATKNTIIKRATHQSQHNNKTVSPFSNTRTSNSGGFDPFAPVSGSNRKSKGPFSGGDFDFIGINNNEQQHKKKPHKHHHNKHGKTSDNRDIHIHIHK